MELIKSRYKITHSLCEWGDYAAFQAVDIESREKTEYLLNVYRGAAAKQYAPVFDSLHHCPQFAGLFIHQGALVAVFSFAAAGDINGLFYKGAQIDWQTRVHYAQELFHLALRVSAYPPEIACAAFLSENLQVRPKQLELSVNYKVLPMGEMNRRELLYLLGDQLKKVFLPRFSDSTAERRLIAYLDTAGDQPLSAVYSVWQDYRKEITAEYEKLYAKGSVRRAGYLAVRNIGRWVKQTYKMKRVMQS